MGDNRFFRSAAVLLSLCAASRLAAAAEGDKPLFPVALGFDFPQAKQSFEEVEGLILKNYYSPEVNEDALYYAAIAGMLRRISPPDNPELGTIWAEKQYDKVRNALEGNEVSLGIEGQFNSADGCLTVTGTLPGSSAEGTILPLDRILRFNGESLKGKSLQDAKSVMDGVEGSTITLTVNRDIKVFEVTLKRTKFAERNLVVSPLTADIALVEIKRFSEGISGRLKSELEKLAAGKFKSLILDLRNDPGGIFGEGVRVSELFLPAKSVILRSYTRNGKFEQLTSANPRPFQFQIAILANKGSASSAEVVAGALRDNNAAFIVGSRSMGKGVFETSYALKNNFKVKFITGAMFAPNGQAWQGKGIVPDFLVNQDESTVAQLAKLDVKERFNRDDAIITAVKLVLRGRK